jgi:hypothetical protein
MPIIITKSIKYFCSEIRNPNFMCSMSLYKRMFYTYMIDQQMQIH